MIYLEQAKPIKNLRGLKIKSLFNLAKVLRQDEFDLVIAHRYKAVYLIALLGLFFPVPQVLAVAHEHNMFQRLSRKLLIALLGRKMLVAGVSESVVNDIASACPVLLSQGRLLVLNNAIDVSQESDILTRLQARDHFDLGESCFVVGTIGRLVRKKNQEVLLRGFAAAAIRNAKLLLIGEGPRRAELELLATHLGISKQVVFAGHIAQAKRYVRGMDLFILPSGHEEAFGLVLLEAMLARVPVLAGEVTGPMEVLDNTGMLFHSNDSEDLAARIHVFRGLSAEQSRALAEAAYRRVLTTFSYEAFAMQLPRRLSEDSDRSEGKIG